MKIDVQNPILVKQHRARTQGTTVWSLKDINENRFTVKWRQEHVLWNKEGTLWETFALWITNAHHAALWNPQNLQIQITENVYIIDLYQAYSFCYCILWIFLYNVCTVSWLYKIFIVYLHVCQAFSVQLCKLNVGFGSQGRYFSRYSVNRDLVWFLLHIIIHQNFMPGLRTLELKVSGGGFCLHFVIWLPFKLQSILSWLSLRPLRKLCFIITVSFMKEWKGPAFVLLETNCWSVFDVLCFIIVCLLLCAPCAFAFCPLRCPAGLNCLCSVPPTAN